MVTETSSRQSVVPFSSNVRYECGCGFKTKDINEAVDHCVTTKHTLSAAGMIRYHRHIPKSKVDEIIESQKSMAGSDDMMKRIELLKSKLSST